MRRTTSVLERSYLEHIFDNADHESPEEKAIRDVEQIPGINIIDRNKRKERPAKLI